MRIEIQEHFNRLDREVVNINNEAARNYLALNDKMNDVLQAVVELKNLIRQEEGGTPLMCSGITARDIALADIRSIEDDNRDAKFNRFKKRIAKMGGYTVFAQMIGTNRATVKQYMNREITPSLDMIVKIAEASTWPIKDCVYLFTGRKVR